MTEITQQMSYIETQMQELQAQKELLDQVIAEDPQRQASCDEVAGAIQASETWSQLGLQVKPADLLPQIHPDWVYVDFPEDAPWSQVRSWMEKLQVGGGELGIGVGNRIYIHREWALGVIGSVDP